ncbi:spore germination protein [Tuberibacillus sp. Marseille-P3662]|uniref:spore germination protein n=1 Tax=Tuberibacillus sp. Marseille-P3662 TaxID=1965358 RepID=UPI000A1C8EC2|nr:spore germination protein [Tuberibacillus sp. Marseille-P3662]
MAVPISFNSINVNTLDTDSSISVGENQQNNWSAHSKNNFGNGMFFGWNVTSNSVNNVYDPDVADIPIHDGDVVSSSQGQAR